MTKNDVLASRPREIRLDSAANMAPLLAEALEIPARIWTLAGTR
jgi:hypothetical protein